MPPGPKLDEAKAIVDDAAREAGRDPSAIGMEGRVTLAARPRPDLGRDRRLGELGATHLSVNTMDAGLRTVDDHLAVLESVAVGAGLS